MNKALLFLSSGFGLNNSSHLTTKEKMLRQQINEISQSRVLDEANIDDAQILTLTREELNELFPGIQNFQLRRTIMTLITETKDSLHPGPKTFARALKPLMEKNSSNDAAVLGVLKECLRGFKEIEGKLKAAQDSLNQYTEILNSCIEEVTKKQEWETQPNTSFRSNYPSSSQTNSKQMNDLSKMHTTFVKPPVRVKVYTFGRLHGAERQVLAHLCGFEEGELHDCRFILAFYPITSRAGTDTDDVLRQIPANKPTVLVSMYHTFNPEYVCPSVNVKSSNANIVEHVNILFHDSHQGVLNCPANKHAIIKIQCILNQYK